MFEECELHELPATAIAFLASVFALFPPPIDDNSEKAEAAADSDEL